MQTMQITTVGTGATTGAASAAITIPNDSSGNPARSVLVSVQGSTYVQPGITGLAATTGSMIVNPGYPVLLNVVGLDVVAHLQLTAAQRIVVTPVET